MNRNKWSHLAYDEQLHIYREQTTQNKSISCIWQEYGISSATVKRFVITFNIKVMRSEIYKILCRRQIKQTFVQDAIWEFVSKRCSPFFSSEIQNHIKLELRILLPLHQIRSFMKTSLNLSYKKENKRPLNLDRESHNLLQQLFAVILVKQLPNIKLVWNIDESIINRDTWNHYSWLRRWEFWSLNNIIFKKPINTISLISNNGLLINLFKYQATSAKHLV